MAEATVRRDKNGIYILNHNTVYRPHHTQESWSKYGHVAPNDYTYFKHKQKVRAVPVSETILLSVKQQDSNYKESWFSHGTLTQDGKKRTSSKCWIPVE